MTYTATKQSQETTIPCPRCDGKGFIQEFRHILNGRCFLCGGAKHIGMNTRIPKQQKVDLVCTYIERQPSPKYKNNQILWLSFDGGMTVEYGGGITDENKEVMRNVWRWAKQAGAKMIVKKG